MRYWEDIKQGEVFELGSRTMDKERMIAFAREFDPQPFHTDEKAAEASVWVPGPATGPPLISPRVESARKDTGLTLAQACIQPGIVWMSMKALLERVGLPASEIEDVQWGCVKQQDEQGFDIGRIAGHLGLTKEVFAATYLEADPEDGGQRMKSMPCPLLGEDDRCTIYEVRPQAWKLPAPSVVNASPPATARGAWLHGPTLQL